MIVDELYNQLTTAGILNCLSQPAELQSIPVLTNHKIGRALPELQGDTINDAGLRQRSLAIDRIITSRGGC